MAIELDRSVKVQVAAGAVSILVFVVLAVVVGRGAGGEALEPSQGLAMVGTLAFFVVFMAALGLALSDYLSEE